MKPEVLLDKVFLRDLISAANDMADVDIQEPIVFSMLTHCQFINTYHYKTFLNQKSLKNDLEKYICNIKPLETKKVSWFLPNDQNNPFFGMISENYIFASRKIVNPELTFSVIIVYYLHHKMKRIIKKTTKKDFHSKVLISLKEWIKEHAPDNRHALTLAKNVFKIIENRK